MKKSSRILYVTIIFLMTILATWWGTKQYYDKHTINNSVFTLLDSAVQSTNLEILKENKKEYEMMASRANDLSMKEKVNIWKPKLDSAIRMGIYIHQFFSRARQEMFMHAHDEELIEMDFKALSDSLVFYHKQLLGILPKNRWERLPILPMEYEPAIISRNSYYTNLSDTGRMAMFSRIEFSVLQSIYQVAQILNSQMSYHDLEFDQFDVLIGQNSMYFLPGQTLEVSAGLGAYTTAAKPIITMNGQTVSTNENGVAIFRKLVSEKDSSGKVNVSVSFKDPNTGLTKIKDMMINYSVLQPPPK